MLTKRIIPCLDVADNQTVKGVNFKNLQNIGDPIELGAYYAEAGADELVFLDITATIEGRKTFKELVKKIARHLAIPFTVGGGISRIDDVAALLESGADKVTINSAAVRNVSLVENIANSFGSQCVVVAIDTFRGESGAQYIAIDGGRSKTDIELFSWVKKIADYGAGEILLTSMDHDGTKNGFAVEVTRAVAESVNIPVIASGGAGSMEHFVDVFREGKADAALAASLFHYNEMTIDELKKFLRRENVEVRL